MKRICQLTIALSLLTHVSALAAEERVLGFDDQSALSEMQIEGNATIDATKDRSGGPGDRNHRGWILSPAVLDACFFGCGLLEWIDSPNVVAIPSGIRRLRFLKQPSPGEVCVQRIIKTGRVEDKATFDFILMNSKGETILSAEGFEALVLEGTGVVAS